MNTANRLFFRSIVMGLILIFFCCSLFSAVSQARERRIDIFFQNMALRDVFNTLAHLAGKNVVLHHSVEGSMTLELTDVTFIQAMDFITKINELAYYRENGTYIIAPWDIIDTSFEVEEQRIFTPEHIHAVKGQEILQSLFPDLRIQVDAASNQIVLRGSREVLKKAEEVLDLVDMEILEEMQLYVVPISYTDPAVVHQTLSTFLPDLSVTVEETTKSLIIEAVEGDFQRAQRIIEGLDREVAVEEEVIDEPVVEDTDITFVTLNHADTDTTKSIVETLFDGLQVEIYEDGKRLILKGFVSELEQAENLIRMIDQQKRQVLIEVQIEEISLTAKKDLGIPDLSDLTFFRIGDDRIEVDFPNVLRLLQAQGASETLARPRLTTIDGEEARLLIGDEIPFIAQDEIFYIDAGIILEFLPRISDDDTITLQVSTEVSSFFDVGRTLPQITTRRAETMVRVKDGESIVIGGLIKDEERESFNKVPFLGELPLLGRLFQTTTRDKDKTEIIIILTPHIIERTDMFTELEMEVQLDSVEDSSPEEGDPEND